MEMQVHPNAHHQRKRRSLNVTIVEQGFHLKRIIRITHYVLHTLEKPYGCSDCGEKFDKKTRLRAHKANKNKKHKCEECGSAFGMSGAFKRHILTHLNEKPFPCEICPKQFTQEASLVKHRGKYQSDEEHRYVEVKKLEAKRIPCDDCDLMFSSDKTMKLHKESVHSGIRPFQCDQCNKSYPLQGGLNQHNKKYHHAFRRNKTLYVLKK